MAKAKTAKLSKEASDNVAAGKAVIDMQKVVQRLLTAVAPEKLDKLRNAEQRHSELLDAIDARLLEITADLDSGIVPGLGQELTSVARENLLNERAILNSRHRRLIKSNRRISKSLIQISKDRRRTIRLNDLRDKVKAPYYYKKYGTFVVPAFDKFINSPMSENMHNSLVAAKSLIGDKAEAAIAQVLQSEKPDLYIKATGNKDRKPGYLADFQRILVEWDPAKASIKPTKQ